MKRSEFLQLLMGAVNSGPISLDLSASINIATADTVDPTVTTTNYPLSLSPALWIDYSDITTLFKLSDGTQAVTADGDLCGYAADKSGNGRNVTVVDANRPTYKTNIQNGRSAMLFGSGAASKNHSTAGTFTGAGMSMVAAIKAPATITGGTTYGFLSEHHSTNGGNGLSISSAGVFASRTNPTDVTITGATPSVSTAYIVGMTAKNSATQRSLFVNALTAVTNGTAVTATDQIVRIGTLNVNQTTNFFTGHILEALYFNSALSDANMAAIIAWLNTKWGVF